MFNTAQLGATDRFGSKASTTGASRDYPVTESHFNAVSPWSFTGPRAASSAACPVLGRTGVVS